MNFITLYEIKQLIIGSRFLHHLRRLSKKYTSQSLKTRTLRSLIYWDILEHWSQEFWNRIFLYISKSIDKLWRIIDKIAKKWKLKSQEPKQHIFFLIFRVIYRKLCFPFLWLHFNSFALFPKISVWPITPAAGVPWLTRKLWLKKIKDIDQEAGV